MVTLGLSSSKCLILWGGGAEGSRTPDLLIANETLYQLSYDPIPTGVRTGILLAQPGPRCNSEEWAGGIVENCADLRKRKSLQ